MATPFGGGGYGPLLRDTDSGLSGLLNKQESMLGRRLDSQRGRTIGGLQSLQKTAATLDSPKSLLGRDRDFKAERANRAQMNRVGHNSGSLLGRSSGMVSRGGVTTPQPSLGGAGLAPGTLLGRTGTQNVSKPTDADRDGARRFQEDESYRTKRVMEMRDQYGVGMLDEMPRGRENLVAARVASGDLSPEDSVSVLGRRKSYLDDKAAREQLRQQRGIAKGAYRRGILLDPQGELDVTGSMLARGGRSNPLLAAGMGVQREANAAEAANRSSLLGLQREKTQAEIAALRAEHPLLNPKTPEDEIDSQIALGIEFDKMEDESFETSVKGMLFGTSHLPPEEQVQVLRRNGIRPDQIQRLVELQGPAWYARAFSGDESGQQDPVMSRAQEVLSLMNGGMPATLASTDQSVPPASPPVSQTSPLGRTTGLPGNQAVRGGQAIMGGANWAADMMKRGMRNMPRAF